VQLQAAAEVCRALEGRDEEHGQRGAAAGHSRKGRRSFAARLASEGSRKRVGIGALGLLHSAVTPQPERLRPSSARTHCFNFKGGKKNVSGVECGRASLTAPAREQQGGQAGGDIGPGPRRPKRPFLCARGTEVPKFSQGPRQTRFSDKIRKRM
jgi:hypothetical protein